MVDFDVFRPTTHLAHLGQQPREQVIASNLMMYDKVSDFADPSLGHKGNSTKFGNQQRFVFSLDNHPEALQGSVFSGEDAFVLVRHFLNR